MDGFHLQHPDPVLTAHHDGCGGPSSSESFIFFYVLRGETGGRMHIVYQVWGGHDERGEHMSVRSNANK